MFASKTNTYLLILVVITIIAAFVLMNLARTEHPLLPASTSTYPWKAIVSSDINTAGTSVIAIKDDSLMLDFNFKLGNDRKFPYASLAVIFSDNPQATDYVDWSQYSTLKLKIMCEPHNILLFALNTFDKAVTDPDIFLTFRPPITSFNCNETWRDLTINLKSLETPQWWLIRNNLELTDKHYTLEQVHSFSITNSVQSPLDTNSTVKIAQATLIGRDWRFFLAACLMGILLCGMLGFRLYQLYTYKLVKHIEQKIQQGTPLVAYQQLPVETKKDRHKNAVLRFMATEYANPDLSLDMVVSALGVNRTKINDILRENLGLTFSTYLNKLRLTEAARLLLEKNASVNEAAYSVGYRNSSYFNRIFKKEYGCTPNSFKTYMSARKNAK